MAKQLPTPVGTPTPNVDDGKTKLKKVPMGQSKPLLFINHDPKHLKAQASRSEITSHLRSSYQPWKYRMQARARREASKSMEKQRASDISGEDGHAVMFETLTFKEPTPEDESQDVSLIFAIDDQKNDILSRLPSPLLYHGNSDPFSSLALPISPLIAELIKFEHAHLHPCIYSTKNAPSRAYGTSYLADMQGPASKQAAVYGYLSRAAIVISSASADPRFAQAAMVLKGRSSALLRAQLANGDPVVEIVRKILALMIAELFSHNYAAALVHSKVLMRLLQEEQHKADFDLRFFFSVVYSEMQRSCMSLTRPCFDVGPSGWVAQKFETVGADAFHALAATVTVDKSPITPDVLGPELAAIFTEVCTLRSVSQAYSTSPVYGTPTPLALYLPARVVLCLGKLVCYYTDHCAGRALTSLSPTQLMRCAAVLGALYWVRKAGHIDSIRVSSTSTIYNAGPMMLTRLRAALTRFDAGAPPADVQSHRHLRFWVLYIGAQEEQGRVGLGEHVDLWFTLHLVRASLALGVRTWRQASLLLDRYPHPDAATPHGSTWFAGVFARVDTRTTGGVCPGGGVSRAGSAETTGSSTQASDDTDIAVDEMVWTSDAQEKNTSEKALARRRRATGMGRVRTFDCPAWHIGGEQYFVSSAQVDTGREYLFSKLGGPDSVADEDSPPFALAPSCDMRGRGRVRDRDAAGETRRGSPQDADLPMESAWVAEQQPYTCAAAHVHLPSREFRCRRQPPVPVTPSPLSYTPRMNDPKLTGLETGPVAFACYPARELSEAEAVAEARKYEFF